MKIKIIAVLLSLCFSLICFFSIPSHAESLSSKPHVVKEQQQPASEKINLNKADVNALMHSFKGIGKKRAEAIIAYREEHQGFKTIEELAKVKGFGHKFVQKNEKRLNEIFYLE